MNFIHERLKEERVRMGLSQDDFAEKGGVKRRAQSHYESGERCPDGHYYSDIAKAGADVQYILTGERSGQKWSNEQKPTYQSLEVIEIPYFAIQAAAGHGVINSHEECHSPISFRKDWLAKRHISPANCVIVEVSGDSMLPILKDTDLVLVDTAQKEISGGKTYVIRMDGKLYVKNLQMVSHGLIQVASFNIGFPPYQIDLRDQSLDIAVIGRVVASMHEW